MPSRPGSTWTRWWRGQTSMRPSARVDIDAVIDRVDLVRIVEEVLEEIDLPALIRDSTGSMTSETVRGVRMTGISADDALTRAVDRALFRRRRPVAPEAAR